MAERDYQNCQEGDEVMSGEKAYTMDEMHHVISELGEEFDEAIRPIEAFTHIMDGANIHGAEVCHVHVATVLEALLRDAGDIFAERQKELQKKMGIKWEPAPLDRFDKSRIPETPEEAGVSAANQLWKVAEKEVDAKYGLAHAVGKILKEGEPREVKELQEVAEKLYLDIQKRGYAEVEETTRELLASETGVSEEQPEEEAEEE